MIVDQIRCNLIVLAPKTEQYVIYEPKFKGESISDTFRAVKSRFIVEKHVFWLVKEQNAEIGATLNLGLFASRVTCFL